MLLTETINNSIMAINARRVTIESKQQAATYVKALTKLGQVEKSLKNSIECAKAMKSSGIVDETLMDDPTKQDLLDCINDCGKAVSDVGLELGDVEILKSKGDIFAAQIKLIWKDAASKYVDGAKGYLAIIGGLSDDPKKAKALEKDMDSLASGPLSVSAINSLVIKVSEARKITDSFAINSSVETFLRKVSSHQATVNDLSPSVLKWLKENKLLNRLKVRF